MRSELTAGYPGLERLTEFIKLINDKRFRDSVSRNADVHVCDRLSLSSAPGHSFGECRPYIKY